METSQLCYSQASPLTLQLLDPNTCLITNLSQSLPQSIISTHELIPSYRHKGYATKIKMLNSLKRCFEDKGYTMSQLPNLAFKMFRSININGQVSPCIGSQHTKKYDSSKLKKSSKSTLLALTPVKIVPSKSSIQAGISNIQNKLCLMHIGRWMLTPHQKRVIDYFLKRGRRIIIADGWNMGKTVTSLASMNYANCNKILIIAPKILLYNWAWHINELKHSFSTLNQNLKSGIKNKTIPYSQFNQFQEPLEYSIELQILDYKETKIKKCAQNQAPIKIQSEQAKGVNERIKYENVKTMKSQVKFKKEDSIQANTYYYTLCSYEYANFLFGQNPNVFQTGYSGLILDQPEVQKGLNNQQINIIDDDLDNGQNASQIKNQATQKQQQSGYSQIRHKLSHRFLRELRKIQSIIICKNVLLNQTADLLPILNNKVEWSEIYDRYCQGNAKMICNFVEQYASAVSTAYYFGKSVTCNKYCNMIKDIIVPVSPACQPEEDQSGEKEGFSQQLLYNSSKIASILSYIRKAHNNYLESNNDGNKQIYLIMDDSKSIDMLISNLQNNKNYEVYTLSSDKSKELKSVQQESNLHSIKITIGNMQQAVNQISGTSSSNKLAVICNPQSQSSANNAHILLKHCHIQQLKYGILVKWNNIHILGAQKQNSMPNSNSNSNCQLYIDSYSHTNYLSNQVQDVSSQEHNSHIENKKAINPERYVESESSSQSDGKMVDEKEELNYNQQGINQPNCISIDDDELSKYLNKSAKNAITINIQSEQDTTKNKLSIINNAEAIQKFSQIKNDDKNQNKIRKASYPLVQENIHGRQYSDSKMQIEDPCAQNSSIIYNNPNSIDSDSNRIVISRDQHASSSNGNSNSNSNSFSNTISNGSNIGQNSIQCIYPNINQELKKRFQLSKSSNKANHPIRKLNKLGKFKPVRRYQTALRSQEIYQQSQSDQQEKKMLKSFIIQNSQSVADPPIEQKKTRKSRQRSIKKQRNNEKVEKQKQKVKQKRKEAWKQKQLNRLLSNQSRTKSKKQKTEKSRRNKKQKQEQTKKQRQRSNSSKHVSSQRISQLRQLQKQSNFERITLKSPQSKIQQQPIQLTNKTNQSLKTRTTRSASQAPILPNPMLSLNPQQYSGISRHKYRSKQQPTIESKHRLTVRLRQHEQWEQFLQYREQREKEKEREMEDRQRWAKQRIKEQNVCKLENIDRGETIQILSDSQQMAAKLVPIQNRHRMQIPKVKSKHILAIKLVPDLSYPIQCKQQNKYGHFQHQYQYQYQHQEQKHNKQDKQTRKYL